MFPPFSLAREAKEERAREKTTRSISSRTNRTASIAIILILILSTMAEHVDGPRLNSDLRYRFEYLSKFLNFTSDDIAMLNTFAPIVSPLIPVIAETVYRKLFSFDITKQYFIIRSGGVEGLLPRHDCGITLDSVQMELRRDVLGVYLKRVFTQADWNDSFLQYLSQIGQMHTSQAGSASINVDYIHINALLGYLQNLLIDALQNDDSIDETTKRGILMAINKFFWIQNDLFVIHYLIPLNDSDKLEKPPTCCWM